MAHRCTLMWAVVALGCLGGVARSQTTGNHPAVSAPDPSTPAAAPDTAQPGFAQPGSSQPGSSQLGTVPHEPSGRPSEARRDDHGTAMPGGVVPGGAVPGGVVPGAEGQTAAPAPGAAAARPPREAATRHTLALSGRTLAFTATVGVLPLRDPPGVPGGAIGASATAGAASGAAQGATPGAGVGYTAYTLDGANPASRSVTFVINGGPGMASAWLQLGAAGPWRLPLAGADGLVSPSAAPVVVPNEETWLDFTDLVFLDPPGTGYAPLGDEAARKALWSVDGDIDALAAAIRRWLARAGRMASPKVIAGESYGGFRAPRLVRALAQDGVGIGGLVLVSPALDLGAVFGEGPLAFVARLPSEAAAARARPGPAGPSGNAAPGSGPAGGGAAASDTAGNAADGSGAAGTPPDRAGGRAALADVEAYAGGEYLTDLFAGVRDPAVLDRLADRVAVLTGLDRALVRRLGGRVGTTAFLHEEDRAAGRVGSAYDASVTGADPDPLDYLSRTPDPLLEGLVAPVSSAMVDVYERQLDWRPDAPYVLFDRAASRRWDWGRGLQAPQSVDALRIALALDPHLRVVVAHGLTDLVCPYFGSVLLLRQLPFGPDRLRLATFAGGHMFYTHDASRAGLRAEAARIVTGAP